MVRGARLAPHFLGALILGACTQTETPADRAAGHFFRGTGALLPATDHFLRRGEPVRVVPTRDGYTLVLHRGMAPGALPGERARSGDLVVLDAQRAPPPEALASLGTLLPTYRVGSGEAAQFATPNLYVKPARGRTPKALADLYAAFELEPAGELTLEDWVYVRAGRDPIATARALVESGAALAAEPSFFTRTVFYDLAPEPMSDPFFGEQWTLHNAGPFTTDDGKGVIEGADHAHVAEAWKLMRELGVVSRVDEAGTGVRLAIIDDGFDLDHEDLAGRFVATRDFGDSPVESGNLFSNVSGSKNAHGTLVTGIATAAGDNGVGLAGACPGCRIIAARISTQPTDGLTPDQYYDRVFDWVLAQNPDVINCSWGADFSVAQTYYDELIERITTQGRRGRGVVIVFAAGNDGGDLSPNALASNPASITVGASDSRGQRHSFSNTGAGLDLVAPTSGARRSGGFGGSRYVDRIWSTDNHVEPACLQPGQTPSNGCSDTAGLNPTGPAAGGDRWEGRYSFRFSHTSAAAPLASGIIALMLETNPSLTVAEVQEILHETADHVSPSDARYDASGFSERYGFGRINALRAVARAHELGGRRIPTGLAAEIEQVSPCTRAACGGTPPPPPGDAGVSRPDAGSSRPDAGNTRPDAGVSRPDAGSTRPDAGASRPDAGSPGPETGEDVAPPEMGGAGAEPPAGGEEGEPPPEDDGPPLRVGEPQDPPVLRDPPVEGGCRAVHARSDRPSDGLGFAGLLLLLVVRGGLNRRSRRLGR